MTTVTLNGISKFFNGVPACAEIDLAVDDGEFFTLLGPSGCGKTTLLRLIAGFIRPDAGMIRLGGRDVTAVAPEDRRVGMVFQNYALFPFMNVAENIAFGLSVQKKDAGEIEANVERSLAMVGLEGFGHRRISELSGGEQQRVAIARSIAPEPGILLLDEPLSNLDARLRERMRLEIKSLQQQLGITTIFVTHDQIEALTMSDRMAVFRQGRCVQVGTPEAIYGNPADSFVASFIGDANLFAARAGNGRIHLEEFPEISIDGGGEARFMAIRPQDIRIAPVPDPNDGDFVLEGTVCGVQFNGPSIDLAVHVRDRVIRAMVLNKAASSAVPRQGQRVCLSFSRESLRLLPN